MVDPSLPPIGAQELALLCSSTPEGEEVTRHPLPRAYAESLAREFARAFPLRKYWLEELPPVPHEAKRRRSRFLDRERGQ
jgi:hypothetical protein